jgi:hypothetical protein
MYNRPHRDAESSSTMKTMTHDVHTHMRGLCVQVIYYKGKNDAWDGYGGATVYTKARQLPEVG